jgi:hypothetical protein
VELKFGNPTKRQVREEIVQSMIVLAEDSNWIKWFGNCSRLVPYAGRKQTEFKPSLPDRLIFKRIIDQAFEEEVKSWNLIDEDHESPVSRDSVQNPNYWANIFFYRHYLPQYGYWDEKELRDARD